MRIPDDELRIRATRSAGPGGQNVNKRSTKVEVTFDLGASRALSADQKARAQRRLAARLDRAGLIHVTSQAERTQSANKARAIARLQDLVQEATRPYPRPRTPTRPTRGSVERRLAEKRYRGNVKTKRQRPADDD